MAPGGLQKPPHSRGSVRIPRGREHDACHVRTLDRTCRTSLQDASRLSRPTNETSDRKTYARRPVDPTGRPMHAAGRTTAQQPSRGARAAASMRVPCERCGAPEQCRWPPERGPCDTARGGRRSWPDASGHNTTMWGVGAQHARPSAPPRNGAYLAFFRFRMVSVQSLLDATACGEAVPTSSAAAGCRRARSRASPARTLRRLPPHRPMGFARSRGHMIRDQGRLCRSPLSPLT